MDKVMSVCGVMCSECGAYLASSKGLVYQKEVADAWFRIYGVKVEPTKLSCGGCLSSDEEVFPPSVKCTARRCCIGKGLSSCAECSEEKCELLERAQSIWDGVPEIGAKLSASDFERYAQPYCGHRERLATIRTHIASLGDKR